MKRTAYIFMILTCLAFWVVMVGGWGQTLDTSYPLGSQAPSVIDDYMRNDKEAWRERLDVDHYFALTGYQVSDADAGKHRQTTFRSPLSADPTTVDPCEAQLYTKYVTDRAELFWIDEEESAIQLTSAGYILGSSIKDDSIGAADIQIENNTYLKAADANGTEVNLIKADTKGVAVIPDQTETATTAAPVYQKAIPNKKYVDDRDTATEGAGTGYADANGTTVFNDQMTTANTWQDLDLSSYVGSNFAIVYLEIKASAATVYAAKPKGYGTTFQYHFNSAGHDQDPSFHPEEANDYCYMCVATDSSGVIQHGAVNNTTTYTIKLVGFIK